MLLKLTLGAAAVAAIAALAPVSAAPVAMQTPIAKEGLVQQVQWRGEGRRYCRYWRHTCAERWGWDTHRFYRCMRRHGCGRW